MTGLACTQDWAKSWNNKKRRDHYRTRVVRIELGETPYKKKNGDDSFISRVHKTTKWGWKKNRRLKSFNRKRKDQQQQLGREIKKRLGAAIA